MISNVCKIEGCNNPVIAKEFCVTHYLRQRRHGSTDRPKFIREKLLENGQSYCPGCNETKSKMEFKESKYTAFKVSIYCKSCSSNKGKIRYKNNKSKHRNGNLKRKFGISLDDYNTIFENQNKKCAICMKENKSDRMYSVDHCHKTQTLRGILCEECNKGLGLFYDSIENLESAIQYLKKSKIGK